MLYIFSFIKFICSASFLIFNLLLSIIEVLVEVLKGVFIVATGFCAEIAIPITVIIAAAVIYKVISLAGSGD